MHCYFRMPADEVTHLWLTSEETCLVDAETGVQYRIRRTEPETFRKQFSVKAKKGDVIILAGKGHEDYQEIKGVKHPMDERVLIAEITGGREKA